MALSSSDIVCPEKRLLVCCARTRMPPAIAREIREIAAGPLDWDYVLSQAAENSIVPLLGRHLLALAPDAVPSAAWDRLREALRANTARCLALTAELIKVMGMFRSEEIQAIPYKGPVLAMQAYGSVTLREYEDLDIVLRQSDMARANELMNDLGYRARFPWILSNVASSLAPAEYDYRDEARRMMIELHTELTMRHFPAQLDLDKPAQRLAPVLLSGHEVWTFPAEDALPILCIHGAKHFWERISWIADIAELVQAQPNLDWDAAFKRADLLHSRRMLHLGLALAAKLLDATFPEEVLARVREDRVAASIAADVERRLLARGWPALDAAGRFGFRRRMVEGTLAGWRYAIRLATRPSEEDWMMMRLPRPLAPLYAALRPLRLLRKYGWAGRRVPPAA